MFRFGEPYFLNGLWLVAMVIAWERWQQIRAQRRLLQFAEARMLERLEAGNSPFKKKLGQWLRWMGLTMLVVALARPQIALPETAATVRGVDVLFLLDVSRSMDSQDIMPSRLERAKRALLYMGDRLPQDRIGLVSFAGVAFMSCPLTRDRSVLKLVIDSLGSTTLPTPGTDLGGAVELALAAFQRTGAKHSVLVIVSDGENFGKNPYARITQAAEEGVKTFCLGVGSGAGWPIAAQPNTVPVAGAQSAMTRMNEHALKQLAFQGNGTYQTLTAGGLEEEAIIAEIDHLEKIALLSEAYQTWQEYYPWLALFAGLLLWLALILGQRKGFPGVRGWWKRWRRPAQVAGWFGLMVGLSVSSLWAAVGSWQDQGVREFQKKNFSQAEKNFEAARQADPQNPVGDYNVGCALLAQHRFPEALQAFQRACPRAKKTVLRDSWYNAGYTAFYLGLKQGTPGLWTEAAEDYQQCLLADPSDDDARYNLELILREIQRQTQPSARQEQQSQGDNTGKNPGGGAKQPGTDRNPTPAKRNDQANPGEEEKNRTRRQQEGKKSSDKEQPQGNRQKGMSQEDALRTLKSLESEESTMEKEAPPSAAEAQEYHGPNW